MTHGCKSGWRTGVNRDGSRISRALGSLWAILKEVLQGIPDFRSGQGAVEGRSCLSRPRCVPVPLRTSPEKEKFLSEPHGLCSWLLSPRFLAAFPLRVSSPQDKTIPSHPGRHPHPLPPHHPIADCASVGSASSRDAGKKRFSGFPPGFPPPRLLPPPKFPSVEDAGGWVLPGLIEIRLSASRLAISPANRRPEPPQSSCFVLIRHRAAPQDTPHPHSLGGATRSRWERGDNPPGLGV